MTYMNYENNYFLDKVYDKIFKLIKCDNLGEINSNIDISSYSIISNDNKRSLSIGCPPCANCIIDNNNKNNNNDIEKNEEEETMLENNLMDKSKTANLTKKEKDLKIFGSYEDVEITDVIERHFILERCFSTYALIKFSLLNILGVTRSFKDMKIPNEKVIEILCDFCIKTHSLVKKYMEIYRKIFETMKERKIISDKKQCDDCINIVTDYLKKTNEIEKEEITKSFTNISKNNTLEAENDSEKDKEINDYIKDHGTFFVARDGGFFDVKNRSHLENILKTIESVFTGEITKKTRYFEIDDEDKDQLFGKKKKIKFIPETPFNLYVYSNKLLNNYLITFNSDNIDYDQLIRQILSLIYYFKNPLIGKKWLENYDDKKDKKKVTKESDYFEELDKLKESLSAIIAVLVDLFKAVKKKIEGNN